MMRVLGVDFGERRIGLAISDPMGLIAQTWGIVERSSDAQAAERVAQVAGELGVETILLGLPFTTGEVEGCKRAVCDISGRCWPRRSLSPIVYWDESLTSVDAAHPLRERGRAARQAPAAGRCYRRRSASAGLPGCAACAGPKGCDTTLELMKVLVRVVAFRYRHRISGSGGNCGRAVPGRPDAAGRAAVRKWLRSRRRSERSIWRRPEEFILTIYMRIKQQEIETPVSDDATPVAFTIAQGETAAMVAQRLQEAGLINDAGLFRWYMRYYGVDSKLAAGDYELARNMNMPQIAKELQHARYEEVSIQIIEGWRAEQVAEMLERKGLVTSDEFMTTVQSARSMPIRSLADKPATAGLEGYLFPDTYRVNADANAAQIVEKLVATLDARFDDERRGQAAARGLSVFRGLTLASIVEREAVVAQERPMIADVYLNRLKQGMYLQADPTVQYALGYQPQYRTMVAVAACPSWRLSETVSIYNTYMNPGLPPGPDLQPQSGIHRRCVESSRHGLPVLLSKGDGTHAFAKTYEEHLRNQALYQQ